MDGAVVTTWWLEMSDATQLCPPSAPPTELVVERNQAVRADLAKLLYCTVGSDFAWIDRLPWDDGDWRRRLARPGVQTWIASVGGHRAGYFELESVAGGDVEIAYLGLLAPFRGKGHGGHLLTLAVQQAWATPGAGRVWVHTCSLDAPHALENYLARGFTVVRTEDQDRGSAGSARRG